MKGADVGQRMIIIHGTQGSPEENWFPWLASELRNRGIEAFVPRLPTPEGQSLENWTRVFEDELGPLTEDTTLIGHSLGAGFALRLVERGNQPVRALFLVSGFIGELGLPDFDTLNSSFVNGPFDWEAIRSRAGRIRVYNGDDDPYVPLSKGEELARELHTDLTVVPNGGHINTASGYTQFDQLLTDITGD